MEFFTYNDYIDCIVIRKQLQEHLEKNKKLKTNAKEILKKIDKSIIYSIQDTKLSQEFIKECISARKITLKENSFEKYNIKDKKNIIEQSQMQIYKIKSKEIYFIIQYNTKINQNILYNILEICLKIMKQWKDRKDKKELSPIIFPIIIYTGNIAWNKNYKQETNNFIKIKQNGFHFTYNILDINKYSIKQLQNKKSLIFNLITLKKLNQNNRKKFLESLIKNSPENYNNKKLKNFYDYFYNTKK